MAHFIPIRFSERPKSFIFPPSDFRNAQNGSFHRHPISRASKMAHFTHSFFSLGLKSPILPIPNFRWGQNGSFRPSRISDGIIFDGNRAFPQAEGVNPYRSTFFWFSYRCSVLMVSNKRGVVHLDIHALPISYFECKDTSFFLHAKRIQGFFVSRSQVLLFPGCLMLILLTLSIW